MHDADHAKVAADLRDRLKRWQERTGDPLVTVGDVPLPPMAVCNPRDGLDPRDAVLPDGER